MFQNTLFDETPHCQSAPYVRGSSTSQRAAELVTPSLPEMQRRVWQYIKDHPGVTDNQIIAAGVVHANAVRARRGELVRKGMVVACGEFQGSTLWRVSADRR